MWCLQNVSHFVAAFCDKRPLLSDWLETSGDWCGYGMTNWNSLHRHIVYLWLIQCPVLSPGRGIHIFKNLKLNDKFCQHIFVHFLWNCTEIDANNLESALVQVMLWCHQATAHYLSQCWLISLSPFGITEDDKLSSLMDTGQNGTTIAGNSW